MDACHGRTSRQHTVAAAYYALCDRAEQLGVPTSLDDPASPTTVVALQARVDAAGSRHFDAFAARCDERAAELALDLDAQRRYFDTALMVYRVLTRRAAVQA